MKLLQAQLFPTQPRTVTLLRVFTTSPTTTPTPSTGAATTLPVDAAVGAENYPIAMLNQQQKRNYLSPTAGFTSKSNMKPAGWDPARGVWSPSPAASSATAGPHGGIVNNKRPAAAHDSTYKKHKPVGTN